LSWQHRLLDFNAVPLADVVVEFNRRNRVQMVIQDQELASIPISASFHSDNIEGFLRLLEAGFDARVERHGESEILLSRRR
jgi:transmembrane sensor